MKWSEDNFVLTDAQSGFRQGMGRVDVIFRFKVSLRSIFRIIKNYIVVL